MFHLYSIICAALFELAHQFVCVSFIDQGYIFFIVAITIDTSTALNRIATVQYTSGKYRYNGGGGWRVL